MVNAGDHHIGRPFELRAGKSHIGGLAFHANPKAIGLGKFVVVVRADGHPFGWATHLVTLRIFGRIELTQKGSGARKFISFVDAGDGLNTVVGCAAQHRMADEVLPSTVADEVANRIATPRVAHQDHLRSTRALQDRLHFFAQKGHVLGGGGAARLGLVVGVSRQGIGHIDGMQALARPTIGFKAPHRALPQGGCVAIAMDKHHGRFVSPRSGQGARTGPQQQGGQSS